VTLAWDAPNDPTVTGYRLWIGFQSGGEIEGPFLGNVLTTTVTLSSGLTYFFEVTSFNGTSDSLPSNEVIYTTSP